MNWLGVTEIIAVVLVLLFVVPIAWLFVRRRLLSGAGGTFECALRMPQVSGSRWRLGVARYEPGKLLWFPAFGVTVRPRMCVLQGQWAVAGQREPLSSEAVELFGEHLIVALRNKTGEEQRIELAVPHTSATGFLSWVESAPPGIGNYRVDGLPDTASAD